MADFISIANLAASKLGEDDQLSSIDDETHLSRSILAVWDLQRRAAIRDHTWNFAMRRQQLPAQVLISIPFPWAQSYKLPADCLRVVGLIECGRRDYQIEGGAILTNIEAPLPIRYLTDVTEPALWDDLFVEAFASRLAWQIADRITGDRSRKADAWAGYLAALKEAKRVDAVENPQVREAASGWELARTGFGYNIGSYDYDDDILIGVRR